MLGSRGRSAAVVVLVGVLVGAVFLWVSFGTGTKPADLGLALIGGLVPGAVILYVQVSFENAVKEQATNFGLVRTSSEGDRDEVGSTGKPQGLVERASDAERETGAAADEGPAEAPAARSARPILPGAYQVQYLEHQLDRSRIDAVQARLRVFHEDAYFQFVSALVSGVDYRLLHIENGVTEAQFWWAVSRDAAAKVETAIRAGDLPLSNPIDAYTVYPDVQSALRLARGAHEIGRGDIVYRFELS